MSYAEKDEFIVTYVMITNDAAFQSVVQVEFEAFHDENITIVLNWAQGDNEFYSASIVPSVPMLLGTGSTTIQLTLQYNTHYRVSIVAFLCEYNTTDVVDLYYGKELNHMHRQYYFVHKLSYNIIIHILYRHIFGYHMSS